MTGLSLATGITIASLARGTYGQRVIARQDEESILFFNMIDDLTTCEPGEIGWAFFGRQAPMRLVVSNVGVPPSSTTASPGLVNKTLSTTVTPFSGAFEWSVVDVPPGAYRIYASIPDLGFLEESAIFNVQAGSDTSCLTGTSSSAGVSSSTSRPTTSPSPSTSSSSSSPSETALPGGALPARRTSTGTIIGVVLGVVALGIIVLAAYFFIRRKKGPRTSTKKGGRWNGLGSTDSRTVLANTNIGSTQPHQRRNHFPGDSMASMQVTSEEGFGAAAGEEKYSTSRKNSLATTYDGHPDAMVLNALPTLHQQTNPNGRRPSYPDSVQSAAPQERHRRNSRSQQPPYLQAADISRSSSVAAASVEMAPPGPSSSAAEAKKANRNSIGAGGGRKRKPVPTYNPDELISSNPSPSSSPSPPSALDHDSPQRGGPSPYPTSLQTSAVGHYTTRNLNTDTGEVLGHKSSLRPVGVVEGKQLHYLMPDMPSDIRKSKR